MTDDTEDLYVRAGVAVAAADGEFEETEWELLIAVAEALNMPQQRFKAVLEEMKAKGQTIANHYRAKYDPTTFVTNASAVVSNDSWDGLSFPAWGEDAEADKAHGKAIGDYWASHGKEIGKEQNGLRSNNNKKAAPVARDEKNDDSSDTTSTETVASGSSTTVTSQTPSTWKEQGKNTGKFWEDFYRSRFDPTYNAEKDLNW